MGFEWRLVVVGIVEECGWLCGEVKLVAVMWWSAVTTLVLSKLQAISQV